MMFPCFLLLQIMMFSYYHWFSREWQATSVSLHRCQQPGPWPSKVSTETPPVTGRRPSPAISDPRNARGWAFSTFASTDLGSRRRGRRALRSSMIFEFERCFSTRTLQVFPHKSVAKFLWDMMGRGIKQVKQLKDCPGGIGCLSHVVSQKWSKCSRPSLGPKTRIWSDQVLDPFLATCRLLRVWRRLAMFLEKQLSKETGLYPLVN